MEVVIVIINHNSQDDTIECLSSLILNDTSGIKIYIVDNSTDERSSVKIKEWLDDHKRCAIISNYKVFSEAEFADLDVVNASSVCLIRAENNGFGSANNIVLRNYLKAGVGEVWFWLLNNDTLIPPDFILNTRNIIADAQHAYQKVGIIGHRLVDYGNSATIQADYGLFREKTFRTSFHVEKQSTGKSFIIPANAYIIGASMMISFSFIQDVGLLCEGNFLYYEEIDITLRGKIKGWSFLYSPNVIIQHKQGYSIDKSKEVNYALLRDICLTVNRLRTTLQYQPKSSLLAYTIYIFAVINRIFQGRFVNAKILMIYFTRYQKVSRPSIIKFLKACNLVNSG